MDDEVLASLGGAKDDLVEAVKREVEERQHETLQDLGRALVTEWESITRKNTKGEATSGPPILPILAVYVLAVNHGGVDDFSPHAYYDRLHELLGGPQDRVNSLRRSGRLWEALEFWSKHLAGGKLGVFEMGIVGQQAYVGVPRRQVLLRRQERAPLRRAFFAAGLRPGSNPSDRDLHRSAESASDLMARTGGLLARWPRDPIAKELLSEVREEFDAWHEIVDDDLSGPGVPRAALRFALRHEGAHICEGWLEADLVKGLTDVEQRAILEEPTFSSSNVRELSIAPDEGGARAVVVDEDGGLAWIEGLPWLCRMTIRLEMSDAELHRAERKTLIFRRSQRNGVLEEVNPESLSTGEGALMVVCEPPAANTTYSFVDKFTGEWSPLPIGPGMVFRPFVAVAATVGERAPRIHLRGGVRSAPGTSEYLHFAPPSVVAEAANDGNFRVQFVAMNEAGEELIRPQKMQERANQDVSAGILMTSARAKAERVFEFPELLERAAYVEAELCHGAKSISNCGFFVERAAIDDGPDISALTRDAFGLPCEDNSSAITRGTTVLVDWQGDPPRLPQTGRPSTAKEANGLAPAGSRVMQLMRMRQRVRWSNARSWLPHCLPEPSEVAGSNLVYQVQALHSLGIVELEEGIHGGLDSLVALERGLALLPRPVNLGVAPTGNIELAHEAILVGCWTPRELTDLRKASRQRAVEFKALHRDEVLPLFPNRLTLLARGSNSIELLSRVADDIGVAFDGAVPLACKLAAVLKEIENLSQGPGWEPGHVSPERNIRYFDPRAVALTHDQPDDRFVLLECKDHNYPGWQYFLWDRRDDRRLPLADRQLGRWFVRKQAMPDTPLPHSGGAILVPFELRFPKALERVLVLSSGVAPALTRYVPRENSPFASPNTSRAFGIPAPPDRPADWLVSRYFCTGNFCRYEGVYETAVWPKGKPIPMLGVRVQGVTANSMRDKTR